MDDDLELWTVRTFDDAAATIALPPRDRWLPKRPARTQIGLSTIATAAAVVLFLLARGFVLSRADRLVPAAPQRTPAPRGTPLVEGLSESATWGKVWSVSRGGVVLRPAWLPSSRLETSYDVFTSTRLERYMVAYFRRDLFPPGSRTWPLIFMAEAADKPAAQLGPGEHCDDLTVRGREGTLISQADGGWRLVWVEGDLRYTIQVNKEISRADLLRIAESLRPVVDIDGRAP